MLNLELKSVLIRISILHSNSHQFPLLHSLWVINSILILMSSMPTIKIYLNKRNYFLERWNNHNSHVFRLQKFFLKAKFQIAYYLHRKHCFRSTSHKHMWFQYQKIKNHRCLQNLKKKFLRSLKMRDKNMRNR